MLISNDKEIARDILVKMIDAKAFSFLPTHGNMTPDELSKIEAQNVRLVCTAYETILRTVAASNS